MSFILFWKSNKTRKFCFPSSHIIFLRTKIERRIRFHQIAPKHCRLLIKGTMNKIQLVITRNFFGNPPKSTNFVFSELWNQFDPQKETRRIFSPLYHSKTMFLIKGSIIKTEWVFIEIKPFWKSTRVYIFGVPKFSNQCDSKIKQRPEMMFT